MAVLPLDTRLRIGIQTIHRRTEPVSGPWLPKIDELVSLVELVDLYPSLCDLAGIRPPAGLQGRSFAPLFSNPSQPWKRAACSQFPRVVPGVGKVMGYSLRSARYRYTEWRAQGGRVIARELYDYRDDPGESMNVVERAQYNSVAAEMAVEMRSFGAAALQGI